MSKTESIVNNARNALKEFIAYEVRLIYSFKYGNDLIIRNVNDAASVTIHDYDPKFWFKRVVVKDDGNIDFITENGNTLTFDECVDINTLIDVSEKIEMIYESIIDKSRKS